MTRASMMRPEAVTEAAQHYRTAAAWARAAGVKQQTLASWYFRAGITLGRRFRVERVRWAVSHARSAITRRRLTLALIADLADYSSPQSFSRTLRNLGLTRADVMAPDFLTRIL